jgi:hypothetical protein
MTEIPDYLAEPVRVTADRDVRMSAAMMRALKKATGRTMSELLNADDDDEADRIQAMAFMELFRRAVPMGHMPDASTLWDYAELVEVEIETGGVATDPTNAAS